MKAQASGARLTLLRCTGRWQSTFSPTIAHSFSITCSRAPARCMPGFDSFVVDDDSEDPATRQVLRKWEDCTPVLEAAEGFGEKKTGGLYPNMTNALHHARSKGYKYALFTQDDMQFVRPFDSRDAALIEDYFAAHLKVIQLLVHFIKRPEPDVDLADLWKPDARGTSYLRTEMDSNAKSCFCAGGIFHVSRTIEAIGSFETSEAKNSARLKDERLLLWSFSCAAD